GPAVKAGPPMMAFLGVGVSAAHSERFDQWPEELPRLPVLVDPSLDPRALVRVACLVGKSPFRGFALEIGFVLTTEHAVGLVHRATRALPAGGCRGEAPLRPPRAGRERASRRRRCRRRPNRTRSAGGRSAPRPALAGRGRRRGGLRAGRAPGR